MMTNGLIESCDVVQAFAPVDLSTAANTGDWVSLKNYSGCLVVFIGAVGTSGDNPTVTVSQAQDVSGTNSKALNFTTWYKKVGATALNAVNQFTQVVQAAANTMTATSAADQKIFAVDITPDLMDCDGGFDCLQASVADVGSNAQLGVCFYILYGARHARVPQLASIVD